jgi:hypothetical protein
VSGIPQPRAVPQRDTEDSPAPPQDGDEIETLRKALTEMQDGGVPGAYAGMVALDSISRRLTEVSEERDRRVRQLDELESDYEDMRSRTNQETSSIHADMLALGRLLGVPYDGLKSPAGYLHADLMPVVRALTESRERVETLERDNRRLGATADFYMTWYREHFEKEHPDRLVTFSSAEELRNALSTPDSEDE